MSTSTKHVQNFQYQISEGHHQIIADVATSLGGNDVGPDPHQILKMSLAACTAITLQMYAQRKQMDLQDINVEVNILSEGKETQLSRRIHFTGNLSAEDKARLLEIAGKCPIHRLLESQVHIATEEF
jgi:putative redox protein